MHRDRVGGAGLDGVGVVKIIYEVFKTDTRYVVTASVGRVRYSAMIPAAQWDAFDRIRQRYWLGRMQYMAQTNLTPP